MALPRFEHLPVNGRFDGVGVKRGKRVPYFRQFGRPRARVVNLSAKDDVGAAINQQGITAILLHQAGSVGCQSSRRQRSAEQCCDYQSNESRQTGIGRQGPIMSDFHLVSNLPLLSSMLQRARDCIPYRGGNWAVGAVRVYDDPDRIEPRSRLWEL